jgi:hypothetical protein
MEALYIKGSDTTPEVNFNHESGEFHLTGKAIPADAEEFFKPVLTWLSEYSLRPANATKLIIKLDYFNISASKRLLFIFYKLNELLEQNKNVSVEWFYHEDEDDMFEVGRDFAYMVKIPFKFTEFSFATTN